MFTFKNPFNICTSDKTINNFEGSTEWKKEQLYIDHLNNLTDGKRDKLDKRSETIYNNNG